MFPAVHLPLKKKKPKAAVKKVKAAAALVQVQALHRFPSIIPILRIPYGQALTTIRLKRFEKF